MHGLTPRIDLASPVSHKEHQVITNDYTFAFADGAASWRARK
jgi:hypothetical protein